jgi:hypothetical protein
MWDALELLVRRAPERFFKIRWIPGHLLDPGKEAKLENFLAEGGDLALARGNSAVDILAEKAAKLAEPKQSLLWKEFLVMQLAKTVQAMQITIWAAFKGHIASDQEVAAADLARLANWEPADEGTGYDDIDDPFLHEFLAQSDNQEIIDDYDQVDLFNEVTSPSEHCDTAAGRDGSHNPAGPSEPMGCDRMGTAPVGRPTPKPHDHGVSAASFATGGNTSNDDSSSDEETVTQSMSRTRRDILQEAKHFPFLDKDHYKTSWRTVLKKGTTVNDILLHVNLGVAKYDLAVGKAVTVKCLLQWAEPFLWALLQTRWTHGCTPQLPAHQKRECSMSWIELVCYVVVVAGRSFLPKRATFQAAGAIAKQLWNTLAKHLEVSDNDGETKPLRVHVKTEGNAGASVTCGLANQHGIGCRVILDDHPGVSTAIAVFLRVAAQSRSRLCMAVPGCNWVKPSWMPSGMLTTLDQVRQVVANNCNLPAAPRVDHCNWRRSRAVNQPRLRGPCIFGCETSSAAGCTRIRWYRVPKPSPWPGVTSGETLCARCYSWGIGNKRRQRQAVVSPEATGQDAQRFRVGLKVQIDGLLRCAELNGSTAIIQVPPDDADRVTVAVGDRMVRLNCKNLTEVESLEGQFVADGSCIGAAGE